MSDYFVDLIPAEEAAQMPYLPTTAHMMAHIAAYGDAPALSDIATTLTYAQFCDHVACKRAFLYEQGFRKNDVIAVLAKNSISAIETFFAITSAGMTAINLPNALPKEAVFGISKKFQLKAIFVADALRPACELLTIPVYDVATLGAAPAAAATLDAKDRACIFFTGGTTSAPKGAVLSHGALMRGAYNGIFMPGSVMGQVGYAILPFSHVFGFIKTVRSSLYTRSLLYTCEDMRMIFRDMPVIRPTFLVLVPGLVELLFSVAKMKGKEVLGGRLHTIITGAAPVPPRLLSDFEAYNITVLPGYGLTESANLVSGNVDIKSKPTSVGKLYGGQTAKLVDGELWLKGDNIFDGYFNDPEATAAAFSEDGWFKTGDLAEFDEDGYLYITGRIKNLIILSNGENVSPEELEEIFYRNKFVKDCVVYEDQINGSAVIAIAIQPYMPEFAGKEQPEIEQAIRAMVDEINATLPTFKRISKVTVRYEDFPKTPSMKIDRKKI